LVPLQHENFYVDSKINIKMNKLKTIANWANVHANEYKYGLIEAY
jgi:hypothetical protein